MKRLVVLSAIVLLVGIGGRGDVFACGDKFLMLGRGTRYERSPAERQAAAILVYASPASELSRTLSSLAVESGLKKAGYRPTMVASAAALDAAFRARKWDVLVVDGQDTQTVSQQVQNAGRPHVVPVLTRPTKDALAQAKSVYRTVVNTPTKSRVFTDVIEDALDLHEDEVKAAAKRATS